MQFKDYISGIAGILERDIKDFPVNANGEILIVF